MGAALRILVVHALPDRQDIVELRLAEGVTAREAARASGFALGGLQLGIGGRPVSGKQLLKDGDRLELLRTLSADPKEARRRRARAFRKR
jgi:putative ubiquitin-RnfH superfamily antitoxin RatB of RatAB toxin-antitoxin module